MTDPKIDRIVSTLLKQTKLANIEWVLEDKPWGTKGYTYNSTTSSITVRSVDGDDQPPFIVQVFNSEGDDVWSERYGIGDSGLSDLTDLYQLVRRQVLQVDKTLDGLIAELEGLPPF